MLSLYCTHHHSSVHTLTQSPLEMRSAFRSSFIFLEFFLSLSRTYLNESSRNPVSELKFIMFEKMARSGTKISQNLALFTICVPFFFWHAGPPTIYTSQIFEIQNCIKNCILNCTLAFCVKDNHLEERKPFLPVQYFIYIYIVRVISALTCWEEGSMHT